LTIISAQVVPSSSYPLAGAGLTWARCRLGSKRNTVSNGAANSRPKTDNGTQNEIRTAILKSQRQHKAACRDYDSARLFSEIIGQQAQEGL